MDIIQKRKYLHDNINDVSIETRIELLQIIFNSCISDKIVEKGEGIQLKFSVIPDNLINIIYNILERKIKENMIYLDVL